MTKEHLYRPIQKSNGDLMQNSVIRVLQAGTTILVPDVLYADTGGLDQFSNPFTCVSGVVDIYFTNPIVVKLGVTPADSPDEIFFDNIQVSGGLGTVAQMQILLDQTLLAAQAAAQSAADAAQLVHNASAVWTVAGKVGDVFLNRNDVGLDNVDDTSDQAKPVSGLQQVALGTKVTRLIYVNGNYPVRPTGVLYVEWVGPIDVTPPNAIPGDTWIKTSI